MQTVVWMNSPSASKTKTIFDADVHVQPQGNGKARQTQCRFQGLAENTALQLGDLSRRKVDLP